MQQDQPFVNQRQQNNQQNQHQAQYFLTLLLTQLRRLYRGQDNIIFTILNQLGLLNVLKSIGFITVIFITLIRIFQFIPGFYGNNLLQASPIGHQIRPFQYICQKERNQRSNFPIQKIYQFYQKTHNYISISSSSIIDSYQFISSVDNIIKGIYQNYSLNLNNIEKQVFVQAIRLMQVNHNINYHEQFLFDHYNFYSCIEEKYMALKHALEKEKDYYNNKYSIKKYSHDQIRLCVCVSSYNNSKYGYYLRNLDSIFQQQYQNYHVVYINDISSDEAYEKIEQYFESAKIPSQKYILIKNQQKKGNLYNYNLCARKYCNLGEVIVAIDSDDSLIGRQVFSVLNAVYQSQNVVMTYGQYLQVGPNKIAIAEQIPFKNLQQSNYQQLSRHYTGNLKTFYVDLLRQINMSDMQYSNGTSYNHGTDFFMMIDLIELAGTRLKLINQLLSEHFKESDQKKIGFAISEDFDRQQIIKQKVYQRKPNKKLSSLNFVDKPSTTYYP